MNLVESQIENGSVNWPDAVAVKNRKQAISKEIQAVSRSWRKQAKIPRILPTAWCEPPEGYCRLLPTSTVRAQICMVYNHYMYGDLLQRQQDTNSETENNTGLILIYKMGDYIIFFLQSVTWRHQHDYIHMFW